MVASLDCRPIFSFFHRLSKHMVRVFVCHPGEWGYRGRILSLWPGLKLSRGPSAGFITVEQRG